jgi:hypothetical protein
VREITLGDWSLELRDDDLARIRFRGHEVLRSVRAVVRDRDWNTAVWTVGEVSASDAGARIALSSASFDNRFDGSLVVSAEERSLRVEFEVDAQDEFWTNRTGLVVLHPAALSGAPLAITHTSGLVSRTHFPGDVSPHQPAFDIRALDSEGVAVTFEGDSFEMEDQRNWTDASFKTYSRPLADPFPYLFDGPVRQAVTIAVSDVLASALAKSPTSARDSEEPGGHHHSSRDSQDLALAEAGEVRFSVGASTAPGTGPTDPIGHDALVEVDLDWDGWPAVIERAAASGLPLDVRLVLPLADPEERVREAVAALADLPVARIAAVQPPTHPAEHMSDASAVRILRDALGDRDVPVIGGTRSHFTELNRGQHLVPEGLDGIAFSTTPMFHTLETLQLEQAIGMQRLIAEQAVRIADGAAVHVGPVTLRAHLNNVATTSPVRPEGSDLSEGYGPEFLDADDERQRDPELAAWTIASAAALAVPGVATVSFFEEWGPRGIRASDGSDRPVADALRALAGLEGPLETAHADDVWAIGSRETLLVANLGTEATEFHGVVVPARGWVSSRR